MNENITRVISSSSNRCKRISSKSINFDSNYLTNFYSISRYLVDKKNLRLTFSSNHHELFKNFPIFYFTFHFAYSSYPLTIMRD